MALPARTHHDHRSSALHDTADTPADVKDLTVAQWEAVFNLLGAVVIADGKTLETEVTAFWSALQTLCGEAGLEPSFTRGQVAAWLTINTAKLRAAMAEPAGEGWLGRHLKLIDESPRRHEVFAALELVALADEDVHHREFDALQLASAIFGSLPSRKVLRTRKS